jgi:hypothetical protein
LDLRLRHVLRHSARGQQVEVLEDQADLAARFAQLRLGERDEVLAAHDHLAPARAKAASAAWRRCGTGRRAGLSASALRRDIAR